MTLAYSVFNKTIEFEEGKINVAVIENSAELRKAVFTLKRQSEGEPGEFILSEDNEIKEFSKKAVFVSDLFSLDFESKKIMTKINAEATRIAGEYPEEVNDIVHKMNTFAYKISTALEFDSSFVELEGSESLIKAMQFYMDVSSVDLPEQIIEFMRINRLFFGKSLFIFYNLKACLSECELISLYKSVNYEKYNMLLIEDNQRKNITNFENLIIVDDDLCVF